jgi:hypothetical protein
MLNDLPHQRMDPFQQVVRVIDGLVVQDHHPELIQHQNQVNLHLLFLRIYKILDQLLLNPLNPFYVVQEPKLHFLSF